MRSLRRTAVWGWVSLGASPGRRRRGRAAQERRRGHEPDRHDGGGRRRRAPRRRGRPVSRHPLCRGARRGAALSGSGARCAVERRARRRGVRPDRSAADVRGAGGASRRGRADHPRRRLPQPQCVDAGQRRGTAPRARVDPRRGLRRGEQRQPLVRRSVVRATRSGVRERQLPAGRRGLPRARWRAAQPRRPRLDRGAAVGARGDRRVRRRPRPGDDHGPVGRRRGRLGAAGRSGCPRTVPSRDHRQRRERCRRVVGGSRARDRPGRDGERRHRGDPRGGDRGGAGPARARAPRRRDRIRGG